MLQLENFKQFVNFSIQSDITWYSTYLTLSEIIDLNPINYKKDFNPATAFDYCTSFKWSDITKQNYDSKFTLHNLYIIKNSLPIRTHIMLNHNNGEWHVHPGGTRLLLAEIYTDPVPVIIADNSNTLEGYRLEPISFTTSNVYKNDYTEIVPHYFVEQFFEDDPDSEDICYTIDKKAKTISANNEVFYEFKNFKWRLTNNKV